MLIDQLPQIVKEAARGLSGANVNILEGADGLGEIAAGLVGQGTRDSRLGQEGHRHPCPAGKLIDEKSGS
jgi:flotillin